MCPLLQWRLKNNLGKSIGLPALYTLTLAHARNRENVDIGSRENDFFTQWSEVHLDNGDTNLNIFGFSKLSKYITSDGQYKQR